MKIMEKRVFSYILCGYKTASLFFFFIYHLHAWQLLKYLWETVRKSAAFPSVSAVQAGEHWADFEGIYSLELALGYTCKKRQEIRSHSYQKKESKVYQAK